MPSTCGRVLSCFPYSPAGHLGHAWVQGRLLTGALLSLHPLTMLQRMQEWNKKWKNAKILIRNPLTCQTMTVSIYDTCDDEACPDPTGEGPACCTKHADMNGGKLVDLEVSGWAGRWVSGWAAV